MNCSAFHPELLPARRIKGQRLKKKGRQAVKSGRIQNGFRLFFPEFLLTLLPSHLLIFFFSPVSTLSLLFATPGIRYPEPGIIF
jgi:hypothetical protein